MRVYTSPDGLTLVHVLDDSRVYVATRTDTGAPWGPPVRMREQVPA